MGRRDERREAVRERIRAAAIALFRERGYDGATVEAIAERADISLPTLFRYFPSKADLVLGGDEDVAAGFAATMAAPVAGEPLLETLRRALLGGVPAQVADELSRLRAELVVEHPEIRRRQLDLDDRTIRAVAEAIARAHGLDADDPRPRIVAAGLHALVRHRLERWRRSGSPRPLREVLSEAVDELPSALELLRRLAPG